MTFAQRRNRPSEHFSESISVVKRRVTVIYLVSFILNMEAVHSSETPGTNCLKTQHYIPQEFVLDLIYIQTYVTLSDVFCFRSLYLDCSNSVCVCVCVKKNTATSALAIKQTGLRVKRWENWGLCYISRPTCGKKSRFTERVEHFGYFGITLTNQNFIRE